MISGAAMPFFRILFGPDYTWWPQMPYGLRLLAWPRKWIGEGEISYRIDFGIGWGWRANPFAWGIDSSAWTGRRAEFHLRKRWWYCHD